MNRKFPVSTKAVSKNFQFSKDARSQSIERMILSKGERADVTGITGINVNTATASLAAKADAAQQKKKKKVKMQDLLRKAQYRDIDKELESSEDDEDFTNSQMKGFRGQRVDPLDRIMHMGTDSAKRRKRTAKLRKLQQQAKAQQ